MRTQARADDNRPRLETEVEADEDAYKESKNDYTSVEDEEKQDPIEDAIEDELEKQF